MPRAEIVPHAQQAQVIDSVARISMFGYEQKNSFAHSKHMASLKHSSLYILPKIWDSSGVVLLLLT